MVPPHYLGLRRCRARRTQRYTCAPPSDVREGQDRDDDDLLGEVTWVRLERIAAQIGSAVVAATQSRLGYRFDMPRAPMHARRDALFHHNLHRFAASDTGRWSLRLGHSQKPITDGNPQRQMLNESRPRLPVSGG
jgi:hypothetical protein